ncbi:MAG: 5-carboxymethyl-2-hydroxymuconate Delta-isomerase [Pseudomonadota bacterium]
MPHITLDYSANLDSDVPMDAVCAAVRDAALATGVFETGAVRVRALRADAYAIADGASRNAYVDGVLRMGIGRDEATRRQVGAAIFDALKTCFAAQLETDAFALSFEVREIDGAFSFKTNTMHARFR